MLRSVGLPLLLVGLAIGALGLALWLRRSPEPSYAGLSLGSTLPRVQAQLEENGGELRCRTLPWTHVTDCTWSGTLRTLSVTPVEIRITADQRHRVLGEIRIEHALPPGTSAEEWLQQVLRQWEAVGETPEHEPAALKVTIQRPRAQSGCRGASARVEESTGRIVVVLFDTTIIAHAAEPGRA
jgi:hypothetical protein